MIDRTVLNKWSWMPHLCSFTIRCAVCQYGWRKHKYRMIVLDSFSELVAFLDNESG